MESVIRFEIDHQPSIGILHRPETAGSTAVLIVVGGPQYRVGSHRQFVQLSRFLATQQIISFRFDARGMGDATGNKQSFEQLDNDIKAATDSLLSECPEVSKIVIWGLCDAASAALIYAASDPRISGLVLLNPWLQNEQAMAKTMVKFYYIQRLLSRSFWQKLISGRVNVGNSLLEAKSMLGATLTADKLSELSYQQRMLTGATNFNGPVCLILSGNDLTAREFNEQVKMNKGWQQFVKRHCQVHSIEAADHTFSSQAFKREVENISAAFVKTVK